MCVVVARSVPLPPEIQTHLTFTAVVRMNASAPEAAKQLIRISHRVGRQSRDAKARHGARFPIGGLKSARAAGCSGHLSRLVSTYEPVAKAVQTGEPTPKRAPKPKRGR